MEDRSDLGVLPKEEAIVTVPHHPAPMRIRIPVVSSIIRRK
nr:hypothetical protein [Candidatus Njordarchaeota archaeon]